MHPTKSIPKTGACALAIGLLAMLILSPWSARAQSEDLGTQANKIMNKYCEKCHGKSYKNGKRYAGGLNLWDEKSVFKEEREVMGKPITAILRKHPEKSLIWLRMLDKSDPMPPKGKPQPTKSEADLLKNWIAAGAPAPSTTNVAVKPNELVLETKKLERSTTESVRKIFESKCAYCHGGAKPEGGFVVMNHEGLIKDGYIVPGNPDQSSMFSRRILSKNPNKMMPPQAKGGPLSENEIQTIKLWILEGAPKFDSYAVAAKDALGRKYVWRQILDDVRKMDRERTQSVPFLRYLSFNHLLAAGITEEDLERHRKALALAVNHLSNMPTLHKPEPIDQQKTIFRIDISALGWQNAVFPNNKLNLYDLILLEYPFGIIDNGDADFQNLVRDYLDRANQAAPIVYMHGDWFITKALLPPLYEDVLQLPLNIEELESKRLGVDPQFNINRGLALRGGMSRSGVSRNNRIVERHPPSNRTKYYWKSYDYASSSGTANMFFDPVTLNPAGGEMIWALPNGLQGYYVTDNKGERITEAPTFIVTDKDASDQTVRNGMNCIRCHAAGMNAVRDDIRPFLDKFAGGDLGFNRRRAMELYPGEAKMKELIELDSKDFAAALTGLFGAPVDVNDVMKSVTQRYLDSTISGKSALADMGISDPSDNRIIGRFLNKDLKGLAQLAEKGLVRRDAWEDAYDRALREMLQGEPVLALDSVTRKEFFGRNAPNVELRTNKPNNVVIVGQDIEFIVKNNSTQTIFIQLVGIGLQGNKKFVITDINKKAIETKVEPNKEFKLGPVKVKAGVGEEHVVLYASHKVFPRGEVLEIDADNKVPGIHTNARLVHGFYEIKGREVVQRFDPDTIVKKTIKIETR